MLIIKSIIQSIAEIDHTLTLLNASEFFSPYEWAYCSSKPNPLPSQAGIWCAKEAFCKAISQVTEFPACTLVDFEVRHAANGRPWIRLKEPLEQWCQNKGLAIDTSISHSGDFAAATVLLHSIPTW